MASRVRPIRSQLLTLVMIPLISLIALWGFATYLTVGDGYRLFNQGRLITEFAAPAEEILGAIQAERRDSMVFLADASVENRTNLIRSRTVVDQKIDAWRAALARDDVQRITPERVMRLARVQLTALDGLAPLRSDVDGRSIDGRRLMAGFTDLVDPITPLYASVATFPDDQVSSEGQALQRLAHARELRARADAVLAGAIAARGFADDGYVQFVQAVGVMRAEYHEAYVQMTDLYRREMDAFFAKEPYLSLGRMEDAAIATGGKGRIPVDATEWREHNTTALAQLSDFQLDLAVHVEEHAKAPAYMIFARILVASLIGLIAVVATVLVSLRIARRLANRLRDLSATAHTLADTQLPAVVDRLRHGEQVDVDAEAPVLTRSADEIGEVGEAFNTVRRTAIATAVEQAQLRAGIRNVFLNIARRSQTLVKSQLGLLDVMERKTVNPDELADLFQIDHLATRMRRYAENLVILGGGRAGRNRGKPVPMQEVLRGAASEAEHYERVRVLPIPPVLLDGAVVSDVIHLVAELIDNATTFSPPHTTVQVSGQMVPHGFAIEVDDRGLGMSETDLAAANGWLTDPPEFNVLALSESPRLGMFVVARIASQHGIRVSLRQSPYGGITAIVLVPPRLVAEPGFEHQLGRREAAGDEPVEETPDGAETRDSEAEEPVPVGAGIRAAATADDTRPTIDVDTVAVPVYAPLPLRGAASTETRRNGPPTNTWPPAQPTAPSAVPPPAAPPETPRAAEEAADGTPAGEADAPKTHLGLPVRVRQARLAPGLRDAPPAPEAQPLPPARSPEEIRQIMSAYQRGTARGRRQVTGDAHLPSTPDTTSPATAEHADEES